MTTVNIWHKTTYRYRRTVTLGIHRLQLRPRESRTLRVVSFDAVVTPTAAVTWANDVFRNAIATVSFPSPAFALIVESRIAIEQDSEPWPVFAIAASFAALPRTRSRC